MAAGIWEITVSSETTFAQLREQLDQALEASARLVLIDATGQLPERLVVEAPDLRAVTVFELPVIFAFEGLVKAGMAELALACDIRVCGTDGALQGRLRGNARARTLAGEGPALSLFLGQALAAEELLDAGLVSAVTGPGSALGEARRLASVIASRGPIATRLGKEAIWRGLAQPLEQALRFETDLTLLLQTTKDRAEGVRAFLEKRAPIFTGE